MMGAIKFDSSQISIEEAIKRELKKRRRGILCLFIVRCSVW